MSNWLLYCVPQYLKLEVVDSLQHDSLARFHSNCFSTLMSEKFCERPTFYSAGLYSSLNLALGVVYDVDL